MRRFFFGLAMIAALGLVPCKARANDRQIAQQIVKSLQSHKQKGELKGVDIDLAVEDGAVYLQGHVADEKQEKLALDVARHVEGVRQVYNELEIKSDSFEVRTAAEPREIDADVSSRKVTQASAQIVEPAIVEEADEEAETIVQDSQEIAQAIYARLKKEKDKGRLKGFTLDLEVVDGVAWLKGKVATEEQQSLVLDVVRRVPGVTKVVNGMAVTAPKKIVKSSEEIAQDVIQRLQSKKSRGELKDFGVNVEVNEGIVWMSGYVASEAQKHVVLETARVVPGVTKVVNDLTISAPITAGAKQAVEARTVSGSNSARRPPSPPIDPEEDGAPRTLPLHDGPVGSAVARQSAKMSFPPQPSVPAPTLQTGTATPAAATQQNVQYVWVPANQAQANTAGKSQTPLAFAPARPANFHEVANHGPMAMETGSPQPIPMNPSIPMTGIAAARFDHPQMPQYAWPSYAPYPNYGAVTYPKQYSAMAWPYIGPFYPYPQVPLGWRKVTLEWDDGWWQLDFKSRH